METSTLLWGLLFGSVGFAYFLYGKKHKTFIPFISGIALCGLPYITTNNYLLVLLGFAFMGLPVFIKL